MRAAARLLAPQCRSEARLEGRGHKFTRGKKGSCRSGLICGRLATVRSYQFPGLGRMMEPPPRAASAFSGAGLGGFLQFPAARIGATDHSVFAAAVNSKPRVPQRTQSIARIGCRIAPWMENSAGRRSELPFGMRSLGRNFLSFAAINAKFRPPFRLERSAQ